MTTELEQEFFNVFGIEPYCVRGCGEYYLEQGIDAWEKFNCKDTDCDKCEHDKSIWEYPEITDQKLLEMICIYNGFQNDEASLFIPFDINNVKDIALQVLTKSIKDKSLNNYYCNDIEKFKAKIQQLFKEEE